jgi:hypothetical protein
MPITSAFIIAAIVLAFIVFAVVLAWGDHQTRNLRRPARADAETGQRRATPRIVQPQTAADRKVSALH